MAKRLGVAALCSVAVLMGASVAFGQIKRTVLQQTDVSIPGKEVITARGRYSGRRLPRDAHPPRRRDQLCRRGQSGGDRRRRVQDLQGGRSVPRAGRQGARRQGVGRTRRRDRELRDREGKTRDDTGEVEAGIRHHARRGDVVRRRRPSTEALAYAVITGPEIYGKTARDRNGACGDRRASDLCGQADFQGTCAGAHGRGFYLRGPEASSHASLSADHQRHDDHRREDDEHGRFGVLAM